MQAQPRSVLIAPTLLQQHRELDLSRDGVASTNMFFGVRIVGQIDTAIVQAALDEIVNRHEILRTTFERRSCGFVQVIGPPRRVPLGSRSARTATTTRGGWLAEAVLALLDVPFKLSEPPLIRAELLATTATDQALVCVVPHPIAD